MYYKRDWENGGTKYFVESFCFRMNGNLYEQVY